MQIRIPENKILTKSIHLHSFATDASYYRILPEIVYQPTNEIEIKSILRIARDKNKHITFRAAGTSLSGQALGDSIIVDLTKGWKQSEILENGKLFKSEPGVIGGAANRLLNKYKRKLGPDPASINACTIGGMIANNSSGMSSGIERNPYNSIKSIRFILANGVTLDTSKDDANDKLQNKCPEIYQGLLNIRNEILADETLINKIRSVYRIKNTMGYSINSFLDFEKPIDILSHLMIGSEGTLGFISSSVFSTVPVKENKLTGLLVFPNINMLCDTLPTFKESGAEVLEMMNYRAIKSIENHDGVPDFIKTIPLGAAVLLFEYQAESKDEIEIYRQKADKIIKSLNLINTPFITTVPNEQAKLWKIRQGLLPSLSATRENGTSVIIEDLAFTIEDLGSAILALENLLQSFGYQETGIYGHGMDGNIHFMITPDFNKASSTKQLDDFFQGMANLVVDDFSGSLKAEHGTGRNMAPFVRKQWGDELYDIMKSVKKLLDPDNILNRGVVINEDSKVHLKNIKSIPTVKSEIDKCIECGFCEPVCPSREYTLSPRKRISLRREIERLENKELKFSILNDYKFYSVDTCAVDGLCASSCPVGINTGDYVKHLRFENNTKIAKIISLLIAENFSIVESSIRLGVRTVNNIRNILGNRILSSISNFVQKLTTKQIYKWNKYLPTAPIITHTSATKIDAIYFTCCMTRMIGKIPSEEYSVIDTMLRVADRAGIKLYIPEDISDHCCGMAFSSKGYVDSYLYSINKTISSLWEWSKFGELPVVFDSSSCAYTVKSCREDLVPEKKLKYDALIFLDSIELISEYLLPKLKIVKSNKKVILHPNCSSVKMDLDKKLISIAEEICEQVEVPDNLGCCGMSGDRGLMYPDLTTSATKAEAEEVVKVDYDGYYSTNIPCEIGMSSATNKLYKSIIYLVDEATK